MGLKNKDLITIHDLSVGEVATIMDVAGKLKKMQKAGISHEFCRGKTLAMIFSKASTRTRVSFETGFHQLGGHSIYLKGRKLVYVGDGNNMAHSLMFACAKVGMNMICASPEGYQPDPQVLKQAKEDAELTGASITVDADIERAAAGADVLYTDVWTSMGEEDEREERVAALHDYQINSKLVELARPNCIVMHCLPAHRGEEITDEVIEGPHSVVFDEAENRLHVQKAIMALLMSDAVL